MADGQCAAGYDLPPRADFAPLLQNEKTTVFSWQELSENLFTTTPDSFDSHTALEELQTDRNPTLYLFSAASGVPGICFSP